MGAAAGSGVSVSFDRVADRYDETRGGEKRGHELAAEVRERIVPGPVLEVGVGTGVVSAALVAAGVPTVGVDISAAMLARAVRRLPGRVARGDALRLPIASGAVGNVLFVWSLHLVGDTALAFAEAARVLRPGGLVIAIHGAPRAERTDIDEALRPLDGARRQHRPDGDEALAAAAGPAGLAPVSQEWTAGHTISRTPASVARELEERVWSFLWRLDDEAWRAAAEPALAAVRALPDPDRPRAYTQWHRISVFAGADSDTDSGTGTGT